MSNTAKIVIGVVVALIIICICAVAGYLLMRTLMAPDATAVPTQAATAAPSAPPAVDDSWDRVKAAGKIVVGTSADYPPFEYYTDDSVIDGFDIALMNEIGRRLGVGVEYRDFAFDGLGGALQVAQIDAAIAAISVTPEREGVVDFTGVYLVGLDGVLANENSAINSIDSIDQLSTLRVGVQRKTVHENWVVTNLVETGELPAENLYVYASAEDAVRDLGEQRVELVLMDAQAADSFASQGGVKVVGKGLNEQRFAIALPKGAHSLRVEIDRVLNDLHNEGVIGELALEYLNVAELQPTPTPAATSTPGPPPACVDGLALLQHLSFDDDGLSASPAMDPGEPFVKAWRVENTGTCTWDSSYRLVYAGGNSPASQMGGQPVAIQGTVAPGQKYDIEQNLVAPLRPGTYLGFWQMENGGGTAFGERLPVNIRVLANATATPGPTQTPTAGIIFTVDRDHIKQGECVTFYWNVENVKEVYFYSEDERWQDNGVAGEGSQVECPPVTTTYYLRVVKLDNSVETRSIKIYVEESPDAPQITRFTVDPPGQIVVGQCVTVKWKVEGDVDEVDITKDGSYLWKDAPLRGNLQDCPDRSGTVSYGIEAKGTGGTSKQQENVNVVDPSTATPEPTAEPDLPVIYSFSVNPNQIEVGGCVGLSWNVGGGTSYSEIRRNGAVILHDAGFSGQEMDCLDEAGSYTYVLEARNPREDTVIAERQVSVLEIEPDNPLAGTSWVATAIYSGTQMVVVLDGTSLTAAFGEDGDLNGSGGCNSYSTSYMVDGNSLQIGPVGSTGKLCGEPPGIMDQEAAYFADLESAGGFGMEAGQLYIQNGSGTAIIEYVRRDR